VREAVAFLTRLPVGGGALTPRAAVWFPLVGAALGALVGAAAIASAELVPPLVAGALAVALELIITGALHADGLADSADALGARDRERALAIMRDHAVGAYGTAALTLDLLIKAAALGALAERGELLPIIAAFAVARAAPLPLAAALPYARPHGTGRALDGLPWTAAAAGVALAVAIAVVAPAVIAADAASATIAAAVAVTAGVWWLARRRLHGVTGDVLGAAVELTATAALVVQLGT
jgi:adenosylcobinamide-GDP ribazoletransferase